MRVLVGSVLLVAVATVAHAQLGRIDLANPTPGKAQLFGAAHAGVGDTVVVGAPGVGAVGPNPQEVGRVDVLDPLTGALLRSIANPTPAAGDQFGAAVAAVGTDILVGADNDDAVASDGGAAYLFDGATGALRHTFLVPGAQAHWGCGRILGSVGGDAVVGCPGKAAYLFDADTGALLQTFTGPPAGGAPRAIAAHDGDLLLSGAGTVYRFDVATGTLLQTYQVPPPDGAYWGYALAALPDRILVGPGRGAFEGVHVFDAASGALVHTIAQPPVESTSNFFGESIAASGDTIMVGSGETMFLFDAATYTLLDIVVPAFSRDSIGATVSAHSSGYTVRRHVRTGVVAAGGVVLLDLCGNGRRSDGEACDDGNTTNGDGCSATCRLEACGALPASGCAPPAGPRAASLQMIEEYSLYGEKDRLRFTWRGGSTVADFGDPRTTAAHVFCLYDRVPANPRLLMNVAVPPGGTCDGAPCWRPRGASGFRMDDESGTPAGVTRMDVRAAQGAGALALDGSGARLGVPQPRELCPDCGIPVLGTVLVQVHNQETGACWEAYFSNPARNGKRKYKARSN